MYYVTNTVTLIPGKRFEGIAHVQKMAKFMCDKFGIETQVVGNAFGVTYRCFLVAKYASMAQYQEIDDKLTHDPFFNEWYDGSVELIHWPDTRCDMYEVYA
ncbi:MAG: hypothetical protein ACM3MF_05975 [Anaerolineae bacterium]